MIQFQFGGVMLLPSETIRVEQKGETGFGKVLSGNMKGVELVDVAHIHFGAIYFCLVKVL